MPVSTKALHEIASPLDLLGIHSLWLRDSWPDILFGLILGVALYLLLEGVRWLALAVSRRLGRNIHGGLFVMLQKAIQKTSSLFLALAAARLVVGYTDPPRHVFETVHFLFTVASVIQGVRWLRAFIFAYIERQSHPDHGGNDALANASGLIRALVNGVLVILALVVILDNLGVNVTGLVAGLGIGGIAIGLAAQGIFSDLFASLSIIFDRPFRVGETISFGAGGAGTVERIGLKSTRLRAVTGEKQIVSNAQLLGKEITSYAGLDRRRFTFPLGLVYQTSPEDAVRLPDILREIVEREGGHYVRAGFVGFGASSLDFELQFDVLSSDYDVVYATRHRIGLAIIERFRALGLSFAYPTQTSFTADPEGRLIMPYASGGPAGGTSA